MTTPSKTTTDHQTIRSWAEARQGKPSRVKGTGNGDDSGILRIDFPGFGGEGSLEEISWDDFSRKFEESGLALVYQETTADLQRPRQHPPVEGALVYQETTADGEPSHFNKLVSREP